jgi:hypothetical protein
MILVPLSNPKFAQFRAWFAIAATAVVSAVGHRYQEEQ